MKDVANIAQCRLSVHVVGIPASVWTHGNDHTIYQDIMQARPRVYMEICV